MHFLHYDTLPASFVQGWSRECWLDKGSPQPEVNFEFGIYYVFLNQLQRSDVLSWTS